MSQLSRAFTIIEHLQHSGSSSFGELHQALMPISQTTLSKLLAELVDLGEVEHVGRDYRAARKDSAGNELHGYELPSSMRQRSQEILKETAEQTGHACALFARVGAMTMKIVDQYNLEKPHWRFAPVGYEWPLVPFHGFAKVFLAYSPEDIAVSCYDRWSRHLKPNLIPESQAAFTKQLSDIRKKGYALEYQEELSSILRLVVPVHDAARNNVSFAIGLVARYIYLLEVDDCLNVLLEKAARLSVEFDQRRT